MQRGTTAATVAVVGLLALGLVAGASMAKAPDRAEGRVYANGELWATFGTADFKNAPSPSVDNIYVFPDNPDLVPVGEASPGDADYNGGRWAVHLVTFTGMDPVQFTSDEELLAHAADLSISGVVRNFQCPLFAL
ncbi:MAG TPA: hypothetical protein VGB42_04380 [Candidatus Thermoplasmatota archaeon]